MSTVVSLLEEVQEAPTARKRITYIKVKYLKNEVSKGSLWSTAKKLYDGRHFDFLYERLMRRLQWTTKGIIFYSAQE